MTRVTNLVARKRKYVDSSPGSKDVDVAGPAVSSSSSLTKEAFKKHRKLESAHSSNDHKWPRAPRDKAAASEARRLSRIDERTATKTCFSCRGTGHAARDCPNAVNIEEGKSTVGICYRCGSNRHSLSRCKKPEDPTNPLPFATCFVCSKRGHISGKCPDNMNGLYPNGGGCKLCGLNDHLVKDCPTRLPSNASANSNVFGIIEPDAHDAGADEDDFHALRRRTRQVVQEEQVQERTEKLLRRPIPASSGTSTPFNGSRNVVATPKRTKVVTF